MFEVTVDSDALQKTLDDSVESLKSLAPGMGDASHINQQFVEWQEADMRRQYANLTIVDDMKAMTKIWPRSRLSVQRRTGRKPGRPAGRRKIAAPLIVSKGQVVHTSQRPILRPELMTQLCDRMRQMLGEAVTWE